MFGITPFGMLHTLISLVAVFAGAVALLRDRQITPRNKLGQLYIATTVLTCLTGFFIFRHGGFGKPHVLGIITLLVLAVAFVAGKGRVFGRAAPYVEMLAYSSTFFFHLVPGITETATRLPDGAPWAAGPDDPQLQKVIGTVLVLFAVAVALQLRGLWRRRQQKSD